MPDGLVTWIDSSAGKAGIVRGGRSYVAPLSAMQSGARRVGARVHFDVRRVGGAEAAVDVRLRGGARSDPHHARSGNLTGAHDPAVGATRPLGRTLPELRRDVRRHPVQVAGAWGRLVAGGALDDVMALYTPDAALHLDGVTLRSQRHVRSYLETLPFFAAGRLPAVRAEDDWVTARWEATDGEPAFATHCRVEHGLIAEQWVEASAPETPASTWETVSGPVRFATSTRGDVPASAVDYAVERIRQVTEKVETPILAARIKLTMAPDPARTRPAIAQTSLDLNGRFVGARVAARDLHEAADLLQRRLAAQMEERAERIEALRRHSPGRAAPGQWRHGDLPAVRPEYFDRPVEDRQLVRHKPLLAAEQSVDEAAFDMDQLDYEFYLFQELGTGRDALLERLPDGRYRLRRLDPGAGRPAPGGTRIDVDERPAPVLGVDSAMERLSQTGLPYVFFADAGTGRAAVVYRRYDGHYGMVSFG